MDFIYFIESDADRDRSPARVLSFPVSGDSVDADIFW